MSIESNDDSEGIQTNEEEKTDDTDEDPEPEPHESPEEPEPDELPIDQPVGESHLGIELIDGQKVNEIADGGILTK